MIRKPLIYRFIIFFSITLIFFIACEANIVIDVDAKLPVGSDQPSPPTNVINTEVKETGISLSWQVNSESSVTGYEVYKSTTSGTGYIFMGETVNTNYILTGLQTDTTYYFVIKAKDSFGGISTYSSELMVVTLLPAPTGVSATDGVYTDKILISWLAVSGAEQYYVYRSTAATGPYTFIGNTGTTSFTYTAASAMTTYYYTLRSYKALSGHSEYSTSAHNA